MSKILNTIILILCMVATSSAAYGQKILRGQITERGGESLPGANITIANENNRLVGGIITDMDGMYYLTVPESSEKLTLVFSFIGFKTKNVPYNGQEVLNVELIPDVVTIEDVVVAGVYMEKDMTGIPVKDLAIAHEKVKMEEMEGMQLSSIGDALQGRMANVDIISGSGDPGSNMTIRIRGISSLNASNEPLIVVDGIPYDTDIRDDFDFSAANQEDLGALVSLSPSDIESIEVLKDAAATAIWGSQGANGVLLINTKRGTRGKTRFSFNQKVELKREPKRVPMLDGRQYVTMIQDAMWNRMQDKGYHWSEMDYLVKYPEITYDTDFNYFDEYNQNTDWLELISRDAMTSESNFSMSGGGDKALYRFSMGYLDEQGNTIGTGFQRINSRLNLDYNFSDKLRVGAQFAFTDANRDRNYEGYHYYGADNSKRTTNPLSIRGHAMSKMPNMGPFFLDENGYPTGEYFVPVKTDEYEPLGGVWSDSFNPLAMTNDSYNKQLSRNIRTLFYLRYQFFKGLIFQSNIGFDIGASKTKYFIPQTATGVAWSHEDFNRSDELSSNTMSRNIINKLIYDKRFNDRNKIVVTAINHIKESRSYSYSTSVSGLGSSMVGDSSNGGNIRSMKSGSSANRSIGMSFNGHYNFDERFLFSLGYRFDGNSRMGRENRWGGYPSASFGWRFSNERFMSNLDWMNDSKIRLSWGQSGNSPSGSYPYIGKYSPTGYYGDIAAISPVSIQLNNLKWEVVTQKNAGLDLELLKHKWFFSVDVYEKITTDLLQRDVKIPSSTGFSSVGYYNSGKVKNNGWEIRLSGRNIIEFSDLKIGFNMNLSRNRNCILELPDNMDFEKYSFRNGEYAKSVEIGRPLGGIYGYLFDGIYQTIQDTYARNANGNIMVDLNGNPVPVSINGTQVRPGDAIYKDVNHDGVIDKYDIVYLGNSNPIMTGGGGINLEYKGLSVRTYFNGRIGQKVINRARINSENMYGANNQSTAVQRRWRYPGDDTDVPRAMWGRGYNYLGSNRFVDDASFIRFKQLSLIYRLPKVMAQKLKLDKADITFSAYDLYTWTNYKGQDPEIAPTSDKYQVAVDYSYSPRPIKYALILNVQF